MDTPNHLDAKWQKGGNMINAAVRDKLLKQVEQLPSELQHRVLDFALALVQSAPKGTPGKQLLHFAGKLDARDAQVMTDAIDAGCEQVNGDEW